jgi:hypothetical protein
MNKILVLIILAIPIILPAQESGENQKTFLFQANLPEEIYRFYDQPKIRSAYAIRADLNPFYLRGDFDGDQIQDCALSIVERTTGKKGILIYHTGTRAFYVVGAGKSLSGGKGGDDYDWMEAWKVYVKKDVEIGAGEKEKIALKGEGILAIKLESSSGIIYWTGKEYKWYQQGD